MFCVIVDGLCFCVLFKAVCGGGVAGCFSVELGGMGSFI